MKILSTVSDNLIRFFYPAYCLHCDERVEKATREKALHYNYGGQSQIVEYDSKEMKLGFKGVQNKATAYMLVYANKNIYNILFEELKP